MPTCFNYIFSRNAIKPVRYTLIYNCYIFLSPGSGGTLPLCIIQQAAVGRRGCPARPPPESNLAPLPPPLLPSAAWLPHHAPSREDDAAAILCSRNLGDQVNYNGTEEEEADEALVLVSCVPCRRRVGRVPQGVPGAAQGCPGTLQALKRWTDRCHTN